MLGAFIVILIFVGVLTVVLIIIVKNISDIIYLDMDYSARKAR